MDKVGKQVNHLFIFMGIWHQLYSMKIACKCLIIDCNKKTTFKSKTRIGLTV